MPIVKAGISPLGYWQKVNQSPTQTKPYNTKYTAAVLLYLNSCVANNSNTHARHNIKMHRFGWRMSTNKTFLFVGVYQGGYVLLCIISVFE